ncbi:hypothetical protein Avbf_11746 [Armadillidium vulgare]|nr:hypothetical protein Avbf_11746 [Armadillidium vulgare]
MIGSSIRDVTEFYKYFCYYIFFINCCKNVTFGFSDTNTHLKSRPFLEEFPSEMWTLRFAAFVALLFITKTVTTDVIEDENYDLINKILNQDLLGNKVSLDLLLDSIYSPNESSPLETLPEDFRVIEPNDPKRSWQKFSGSWGKRSSDTKGISPRSTNWSSLRGSWGKRSPNKLESVKRSWGKRLLFQNRNAKS